MAAEDLFLDTSLVVAATVAAHPAHVTARQYLAEQQAKGAAFCISSQICREFLVVLTRQPVSGRSFTVDEAIDALDQWRKACTVLGENDLTLQRCVDLVSQHDVHGKQVHDCNIVAVMLTHGVPRLATRSAPDFKRYAEISVDAVTP
jgi:predicted nucleic acid-binding protein